jgi:hypothetical protein
VWGAVESDMIAEAERTVTPADCGNQNFDQKGNDIMYGYPELNEVGGGDI